MADKDQFKGKFHEAKGSVKEKAGEFTGDRQMESEGPAEKFKGKAEGFMGNVKDKAKELGDKAKGAADAFKDETRDKSYR